MGRWHPGSTHPYVDWMDAGNRTTRKGGVGAITIKRNGAKSLGLKPRNTQHRSEPALRLTGDESFRQRSAGSARLYCSRKCRDRTQKAIDRARPDYIPIHRRPGRAPCAVEGCDLPSFTWKMCPMHYERAKKYGDPGEAAARRCAPGAAEWRV